MQPTIEQIDQSFGATHPGGMFWSQKFSMILCMFYVYVHVELLNNLKCFLRPNSQNVFTKDRDRGHWPHLAFRHRPLTVNRRSKKKAINIVVDIRPVSWSGNTPQQSLNWYKSPTSPLATNTLYANYGQIFRYAIPLFFPFAYQIHANPRRVGTTCRKGVSVFYWHVTPIETA